MPCTTSFSHLLKFVNLLDTDGLVDMPVCGLWEPVSVNRSLCKIAVLLTGSSSDVWVSDDFLRTGKMKTKYDPCSVVHEFDKSNVPGFIQTN